MPTQIERIRKLEIDHTILQGQVMTILERQQADLEKHDKMSEDISEIKTIIASWGGAMTFFTKLVALTASLVAIVMALIQYF